MPDLVFDVVCRACGRTTLARVERIRDAEIAVCERLLRACAASEPLGEAPMLGEIMQRLNVAALKV